MANGKKINCKHGLTWNEELQARKLRQKLESGDKETNAEIKAMFSKWFRQPQGSFLDWLVNENKIVFSALKRMNNWQNVVFGTATCS